MKKITQIGLVSVFEININNDDINLIEFLSEKFTTIKKSTKYLKEIYSKKKEYSKWLKEVKSATQSAAFC